jgi:5-formyltetrahydrofolate cyclo-ligase
MTTQDPAPAVFEAKARLRREMAERLAAVDAESARRAAARLRARVLALPEVAAARRVFTCLSFGAEIDTLELAEALLSEGREVYLPRAVAADGSLRVHRYPCALRTLSFGLRQPIAGAPELAAEAIDATVDVALVLGLAFDRRGVRLGYGSGYFDRFLRGRPFPAVGLAFDFQLVDRLPAAEHDVPMAVVVTDKETVRPSTTD